MDEVIVAAIKALGAVGGSFLALVFQPPVTMREAFLRAVFSVFSGFLFGDPVRVQYLRWPETWQMWVASCAGVALISWWVFGAVLRLIRSWTPKA